jgi:hypothetical protein
MPCSQVYTARAHLRMFNPMRARWSWYTAVLAWLLSCNMLACAHPLAIADQHSSHYTHIQTNKHNTAQHDCCAEKIKTSADKCCQQDTQLQQNTLDVPLAHFNHLYVIASPQHHHRQNRSFIRHDTYPPPLFLSSQRLRI